MKRTIEINALLAWAFGQELSKLDRSVAEDLAELVASPSPWDAITRLAELGVRIDTSKAIGGGREDQPHPDALAVSDAVWRLASADLTMPEGFTALADCTGLTDAELRDAHDRGWTMASVRGDRLPALIVRRALVGNAPNWQDYGPIYRRKVKAANGKDAWFRIVNDAEPGMPAKPREAPGLNPKTKRPYPGAYQKIYLDPCPSLLVLDRIEYQAWALGLAQLALDLEGKLERWEIDPRLPLLSPWEAETTPRILLAGLSTMRSGGPFQPVDVR